jgi:hypothetical protein
MGLPVEVVQMAAASSIETTRPATTAASLKPSVSSLALKAE